MLTIRAGGSTDSDDTEVTVIPLISLSRPAVMTLTPPARRRMADRKSLEETSRSTAMLQTIEFMAASLFRWIVPGLKQMAQDRTLQRREIGRAAPARPRDIDRHVARDQAVFDHQNAVGQRHGF